MLSLVGMSGVRVNAEAGNSLDSFISKFRNANNAIWAIFCRFIDLKIFKIMLCKTMMLPTNFKV